MNRRCLCFKSHKLNIVIKVLALTYLFNATTLALCVTSFSHELALRLQEEEDRRAAAALNEQRHQQAQAQAQAQAQGQGQGQGQAGADRRPREREERRDKKDGKDVSLKMFSGVAVVHWMGEGVWRVGGGGRGGGVGVVQISVF